MYFIVDPIPNLETYQIMKKKKYAYMFGDGVAWEIVDKNNFQSCLNFLNKG
jgi:hypothetical protein